MSTSIRGGATKREGSASIRSRRGTPVYECQYSWIVVATAKDEPYTNVLSTTGLPLVGITADPTGYAICTAKNATRRAENPLYWDVVCDFSSEIDDGSGSNGDPTSDPTTWVPLYETKFEMINEIVQVDYAGNPIQNSVKQPFNGITVFRTIPVWEFFQIEASSVTDNTVLSRTNVVNSASFTRGGSTYAAKTLHCTVLSSVIGRYYGTLRRLTQYRVKYNDKKWTLKLLDCGTRISDGAGGYTAYYADASTPVKDFTVINGPLNGSGARTTTAATLEFDMYNAVSFSFLR